MNSSHDTKSGSIEEVGNCVSGSYGIDIDWVEE